MSLDALSPAWLSNLATSLVYEALVSAQIETIVIEAAPRLAIAPAQLRLTLDLMV
jgi:hypothetical protein